MTDPNDPFEALSVPDRVPGPRPDFVRSLRSRLVAALGDTDPSPPTIPLPPRRPAVSPTDVSPTDASSMIAAAVVPYLTVHDGAGALEFYAAAFGAEEVFRVPGDDGRLGHAEFTIGDAAFYLSDEYPEMGVVAPRTLGGSTTAMHLTVADADGTFARAVEAGAEALMEPADQPHGARHGTLRDPFGHRWMVSQPIEQVSIGEYASRMADGEFSVTEPPRAEGGNGNIWPAVNYRDAPAGIRFLVDVFGFSEQLVVSSPADDTVIEHSQLRWPEGGVVQAATADRHGNIFSERPVGSESIYVITTDPMAVHARCVAAGVELVGDPASPDYDPGGLMFTARDPEGNLWTFGTYAGETSSA